MTTGKLLEKLDHCDCLIVPGYQGITLDHEITTLGRGGSDYTAMLLAQALDSKKGKDIRVLETDSVTTLADYFVLCTGTSAPQLKALADAGERAMKEAGILPHHVEGHRGGTWILQDYGDVVVHLFDKEARAFYDLDRLWEDAKVVDLSQVLQPGE